MALQINLNAKNIANNTEADIHIVTTSSGSIKTADSPISCLGQRHTDAADPINNQDLVTKAYGDANYLGGGGGGSFPSIVYLLTTSDPYNLMPSTTPILTVVPVIFATQNLGNAWFSYDATTGTFTALFSGMVQIDYGLSLNISAVSAANAQRFYFSDNFIVNGATIQNNVGGRPNRYYPATELLTDIAGAQHIIRRRIYYNFNMNDTFRVECYWNNNNGVPSLGINGIQLQDIGTDNPIGGGDYSNANWSRGINLRTFVPEPA